MKRSFWVAIVVAAAAPVALTAFAQPQSAPGARSHAKSPPAAPHVPDAPTVASLGGMLEKGITWGSTHAQIVEAYNGQQGLFEKDFAPLLAQMQPGVVMDNLRADMLNKKRSVADSWVAFGDTPNGYDSLPISHEYTYRNNEGLQKITRNGRTRYLFYINDHLWKVYDEIPLAAGGALGATFQEAVAKLGTALGAPGRVREADPDQGRDRTEADWVDSIDHLRAIDRFGGVVALALEDRSVLSRLDTLRANKAVDPNAIDPSVAAVTKKGVSDPSEAQAAPSASAKPHTKPPKH